MLERKKLRDLNDFFLELNARKETGVYFYRINGYNEAVKNFIVKYYEAARSFGVVIEGKIRMKKILRITKKSWAWIFF